MGTQDRNAFANTVLARLRSARPDTDYQLDLESMQVRSTSAENDKPRILFLDNFYEEHLAAPPSQEHVVLERIVRLASQEHVDSELDDVRAMLRPRLRARRYFETDVPAMLARVATDTAPPRMEHRA